MKKLFNKNPFIIAELSGNHKGSLSIAKTIIKKCKLIGVDAIKFQTLDPDKITFNSDKKIFKICDKKSIWYGRKLHDLYKESAMSLKMQTHLFKYAKKIGIIAFSSPFDLEAVDYLEKQNVPFYKIASLENTYYPLIKKVIDTKKHILISTGASKENDIEKLVKFLKKNNCKNFSLLKCTSAYPAPYSELDLNSITGLRKKYKCAVGYSDHTDDILASVVAVSKGASIIEKHIKIDEKTKSIDSKFSLSLDKFAEMVKILRNVNKCLGSYKIRVNKSEKKANKNKRSIIIVKEIKKGERITKKNASCLRPGNGIETKFYNNILYKKASRKILPGTPLKFKLIK